VVWVLIYRKVEIADRLLQTISGTLIPEVPSFQVGLVSLRVYDLWVPQHSLFPLIDRGPDLLGNRASDAVLQCQCVPHISLKALAPYVPFDGHRDQLGSNPNSFARTQHGSFHYGSYLQ